MPRGRPRGSAAASPARATRAPRTRAAQPVEFTQSLVLNQWLFGLFGLDSTDGYYPLDGGRRVPLLEAFKQRFQINEHSEEGLDETTSTASTMR